MSGVTIGIEMGFIWGLWAGMWLLKRIDTCPRYRDDWLEVCRQRDRLLERLRMRAHEDGPYR